VHNNTVKNKQGEEGHLPGGEKNYQEIMRRQGAGLILLVSHCDPWWQDWEVKTSKSGLWDY